MTLRVRLTLLVVAIVLPILAGGVLLLDRVRSRAVDSLRRDQVLSRAMSAGVGCTDGADWPAVDDGLTVVAGYDLSQRALEEPALPLHPSLVAALERGELLAQRTAEDGTLELLVRAGGEAGRCAFVLARRGGPWRGGPPGAGTTFVVLMLPAALVTLLLLGLLAPLVGRVRRLTDDVRRFAASGYQTPIRSDDARDEVGELARAFSQTGQALRAELADKERREGVLRDFVANTTHDLAMPLSVLALRLTELHGSTDEKGSVAVAAAMVELDYLHALVRNLAVAARLEDPDARLTLETVDLRALVARVAARHRPVAEQRGIVIEHAVPESPTQVRGDVVLLEQAVSNLVHNAVRHHAPGHSPETLGHVALVLESTAEGRFSLAIVDDGEGMSPEARAELDLAHDPARPRGRGIRIARRVAELHGLQLRFAEAEGGGLEVRLEHRSG